MNEGECVGWKLAEQFVMPIGKHRGKTIGDIASEDGGLRYLKWASENMTGTKYVKRSESVIPNIKEYLTKPDIQKEIERIHITPAMNVILSDSKGPASLCAVGLGLAIQGLCHAGRVKQAIRLVRLLENISYQVVRNEDKS
jgi:hypothetical protein